MHKLFIFVCLLFSNFLIAFGQQPSSEEYVVQLRKKLSRLEGKERVDALIEFAEYSKELVKKWTDRADSQKHYATIALQEAEKIGYKKGITRALIQLGEGQLRYSIPLIQGKKDATDFLKQGEVYLLKAVPLAEQLKDNNLLGSIYESLSLQQYLYIDNHYKINNFKKAAYYYNKAGNTAKEGEVSTWLCEDFRSRGLFEEGLQYCNRSMQLSRGAFKNEKIKNDADYRIWQEWNSLNNMSEIYQLGGDFQTAKEYTLKAQSFASKHNPERVSGGYLNLAYLFEKMGQYDSAKYYMNKTTTASFGPGNEVWYRISKANLLADLKDYDSAIETLKVPYENFKQAKASWRVLLPLAKAYSGKKNFAEALKLAQESFKRVGADQRVDLMKHYEVLAAAHEGVKNYDSAYHYLKAYYQIKDSILTKQFLWNLNKFKSSALDAKKTAQIALLMRDNLLKEQQLLQQLLLKDQKDAAISILDKDNKIKDQQLQLKEQLLKEQSFLKEQRESALALLDKNNKLKDEQLKQQTILKNALLAGLFLILVLGFFIVTWLSLKRKNEKLKNEKRQTELQQQSAELEMQALRAQMNPHFIFNCLSSINKFILNNESRAASDYLTRFSRLIRRVLTNSQLSMIPLSDEVEMLRLYLDMERLRFSNSFDYNIVYANEIEPESIYVPPMLLQPFCENAIWHGLMHKEGQGQINVVMRTENNMLNCTITDNGIGREKAAELKSKSGQQQKSFGLKITTERLSLFNQQKNIDSFYKTEDIINEVGNVSGTKVNLNIRYKESVEELI